jgi:PPK2 family polyphosphate:nucleotide phosphotransferase
MAELQNVLYASRQCALLVVFQGMDTAGKDSVIKHVMSGVNPQGVRVTSFEQPSEEEVAHDYLWRSQKALPERGFIGIFNRSYYEEVLVARVHREVLEREGVSETTKSLWKARYEEINNFERFLARNCVVILKFALNLSKAEQKKRLLDRIETREKNWKFALSDLTEREHWNQYMSAYESMFNHTSTECAPWYFVPADHKWYTRVVVADVIVSTLKSLDLKYPAVTPEQKKLLAEGSKMLEAGKD